MILSKKMTKLAIELTDTQKEKKLAEKERQQLEDKLSSLEKQSDAEYK